MTNQSITNQSRDCAAGFLASLMPFRTTSVGGMPMAALDIAQTADLMIEAARHWPRGNRPLYFTSANGEVLSRAHSDPAIASLFTDADLINADGQPLVMASKLLGDVPLPERVATTDLYDEVAARAQAQGLSFYLLGATEEVNRKTASVTFARYPGLNIVGRANGFHKGEALEQVLDEINTLKPDILWLAMGVPVEQRFMRQYGHRLSNVGLVKTSGGLFNFIAGVNRRAPGWMQQWGLEWAHRLWLEPRRLFWRYLTTNPQALFLLLTRTR